MRSALATLGRILPAAALFSLVSACGSVGYRANGIAQAGDVAPAAVRTLGCLDVGFDLRDASGGSSASDWSAMSGSTSASSTSDGCGASARPLPMLVVRVGNRCVRPAAFDLTKARVVAHGVDGSARRLELVDPRSEIVPLHVEAYSHGREKVRLAGAAGGVSRICVHVEGIAPDAPGAQAAPVCFETIAGLGWEVR